MSALAKMAVDLLLKEIPQEVRDQLNAENLELWKAKIIVFIESIPTIQDEQAEQRKLLEAILEKVSVNDDGSNSGKPKRIASRRTDSSGDAGGSNPS